MIKTFLIFSPILFIICGFPLLELKGINRYIGKILIIFGFINILLNYLIFKFIINNALKLEFIFSYIIIETIIFFIFFKK